MNLLVGATGFVGGHLVEYLFQQGEISKGIFRKGSHLKIMDSNGVQGVEADLLDHHSLHEAMEGVDTIYNLASPMPGADSDFMKVNIEGTLNLLDAASKSKIKTFVHLSTLDVHGFGAGLVSASSPFRPSNEYQRSKAEAERLLMEFCKGSELPRVVVIRSARAVGSRDESFVVPILRMVERGKVVLPGSGSSSFAHPKDAAQAMYKVSSASSKAGSVYLVKSFDATPEGFARSLLVELGTTAQVKRRGILDGTRLPQYTTEQLKASLRVGPQQAWGEIGYQPQYSIQSTCKEIADWYRREPWAIEGA